MSPHQDDIEMPWSPGWEWLAAVVAIHFLVAVPWLSFLGAWPLALLAVSLFWHVRVFVKGETWRFRSSRRNRRAVSAGRQASQTARRAVDDGKLGGCADQPVVC